jgi:aryl-alcohol dehydrogenase-like predicted oxidoreductase
MGAPGHTALGAWSGGRYMHFGEPLDEERYVGLLRPDSAIHTVVTADVYGAGEADLAVGRAIAGLPRESFSLIGAIGHDFYGTHRDGARGFPRFTSQRAVSEYGGYLREATERSLERCGVGSFDVLLLHNPDRVGYTSPAVWDAMAGLREAGLCRAIGVAPGPANGFTLDVIGCLERFGDLIDWTMLILNPLEPWPGLLVLPACARHGVRVLARVVDYGGLFHDDVPDEEQLTETDHRRYRPAGWVQTGRDRLDELRPIADRHGLTMLQLSCTWTLAQPAVACVAPTLIQETGPHAKRIEIKRAELAAVPHESPLSASELETIERIGDNTGCMKLKGASPVHEGDERPDAWPLDDELREVGRRFGIEAERDLVGS